MNRNKIVSAVKRQEEEKVGFSLKLPISVKEELQKGVLKEIVLNDFKLQHNFEFIWEKDSLFTDKYISISEEFLTIPF